MKQKALILLIILLFSCLGCRPPETAQAPVVGAYPQTVRDSSGAEVTIPAQPQQIVSLSPGMTETLYAIGAGPQVVATDKFSDYPDAAKQTAKLDALHFSTEQIVALQPDLVFLFSANPEQLAQLRALQVRIIMLAAPESLEGVLEQIRLAGRVTGHPNEADQLTRQMQQRIERVRERLVPVSQGPRVFIEIDATGYTAAPQSFIGSMLQTLKAQNIAEGATRPFPQLSREVILERNPEVIFLLDASHGETPEKVKTRPGWENVAAVRTGRVYALDENIVSRPGPRVVDALEQMAKLLHPDRFG